MTVTENPRTYKYIGTRPVRHDGLDKVTGKARFAADLDMTGQLRAALVRSPHAHARIVSIDTSKAEAMPGVKAVVTGADFADLDPTHPEFDMAVNLMARDEVLYNGHVVAAVAAVTTAQAAAAAAAVEVSYDPLPAVLTIDEAIAEGSPIANPTTRTLFSADTEPSNLASVNEFGRGDVEAGFAAADIILEREFRTVQCIRAISSPTPAWSTAVKTAKPRYGRPRRDISRCAPKRPLLSAGAPTGSKSSPPKSVAGSAARPPSTSNQ